ncbi:MAG: hypothetical protein KA118_14825 [Verrucomicrobia bacterium]|nr:hypothetical protein [Verrucomicrobiota bacterium]
MTMPRVKIKGHTVAAIEAELLKRVRLHGRISRVALSRELHIVPCTAGIYVDRLIAEGFLVEPRKDEEHLWQPGVRLEQVASLVAVLRPAQRARKCGWKTGPAGVPGELSVDDLFQAVRAGDAFRVCAKINSDFAGGDWAGWQGATSEHTRAVCERGATQPARPRPPARRRSRQNRK